MIWQHTYRPDVDGLRAVAVLAVLAFHAFPEALPGGFVGVDVFFVISGFLISGLIFQGLQHGTFSFADFYWRRVRRIFPALVLVLAASLALGWLVLLPDEYSQLGKHVVAGAAFLSNIVLWREAGYFDVAAGLKPLLHLWSLGVEEQYYLVWPLVLWLLRERLRLMLWTIAGIAAVSFALNLWLTFAQPAAAFYLPATRFWELLAGALLAFFAQGKPQTGDNLKAAAGALLLGAGLLLIDDKRAFPGAWALLPVAGTALIIRAGPQAWINRSLLASRPLVYVGLISYPLYLWHWPLLAYARIVEGGEPGAGVRLGLAALSIVLACLTYELVEKNIRFAQRPAMRRLSVPGLALSMAAAGVLGVLALHNALPPQSASLPLVRHISSASTDWDYGGDRVIPGDTRRAVLFFGDSHMQQYWPRIEKIVSQRDAPVRSVIFSTHGGCAPVPAIERRGQECSAFVDAGFALARRAEIETVVLAGSWVGFIHRGDYYRVGDPRATPLKLLTPETEWVLENFAASLRDLVQRGKRVVIVLSSPRGDALDPKSAICRDGMTVQVCAPLTGVPRAKLAALTTPIDERLRRIAAAVGASVIDPADWLCSASHCPSADEGGRPLYKDASHVRASVARERFSAVDSYVYLK
jgi:peptidoglycan/LPS O-acetylase OafA/YrhL